MKIPQEIQDKMRWYIGGMDSNKRYRWDLFWAAGITSADWFWNHPQCDEWLNYHIDSALRRIVPPLEATS
jgi:hypothetical protein